MSSNGVDLVLHLLWGQEVLHQKLLRELFEETDLAVALGLWNESERPSVRCEPVEQLFDLGLLSPGKTSTYIELKVRGTLSAKQEDEQREFAKKKQAPRAYILLGPSYFCWRSQFSKNKHPATVVGPEQLAQALREELANIADEALKTVATTYLHRLESLIRGYQQPHPRNKADEWRESDLRVYRFLDELGSHWPSAASVYPMHRRDGKARILNPRPERDRQRILVSQTPAIIYWEIVEDVVRFKVNVADEYKARRQAVRRDCRAALLEAAEQLKLVLSPINGKTGKSTSLAQLQGNVRAAVLDDDGKVDAMQARQLFARCERLLKEMVKRLSAS